MGTSGEKKLLSKLERAGIKARRVPRSAGAIGADYSDIEAGPLLVEEKTGYRSSFPMAEWWVKANREAARYGKRAAIHYTHPNLGSFFIVQDDVLIDLLARFMEERLG